MSRGRQTVQYLASNKNWPLTGVSPSYWVRFRITETIPVTFSAILGKTATTVAAESTAGIFPSNNGGCIYALNKTAGGAITLKGNTDVEAPCGVWDNSTASDSLSMAARPSTPAQPPSASPAATAPSVPALSRPLAFSRALPTTRLRVSRRPRTRTAAIMAASAPGSRSTFPPTVSWKFAAVSA